MRRRSTHLGIENNREELKLGRLRCRNTQGMMVSHLHIPRSLRVRKERGTILENIVSKRETGAERGTQRQRLNEKRDVLTFSTST